MKTERVETVEKTDSVIVEQRDTLREVLGRAKRQSRATTITIDRNDRGDTLKVVQITDRDRARNHSNVVATEVKVIERIDTVYIQKDSVSVEDKKIGLSASADGVRSCVPFLRPSEQASPYVAERVASVLRPSATGSGQGGKKTGLLTYVKWITALICAVVVLVITVKVCLLRR